MYCEVSYKRPLSWFSHRLEASRIVTRTYFRYDAGCSLYLGRSRNLRRYIEKHSETDDMPEVGDHLNR